MEGDRQDFRSRAGSTGGPDRFSAGLQSVGGTSPYTQFEISLLDCNCRAGLGHGDGRAPGSPTRLPKSLIDNELSLSAITREASRPDAGPARPRADLIYLSAIPHGVSAFSTTSARYDRAG